MFTFGRDREKESAANYVRDPQQIQLIHGAVDAVHDFLKKRISSDAVQVAIIRAFVEGGPGVWEQAGTWLRKLNHEFPSFLTVWQELSQHVDGRVRYRVACFLNEMPTATAREIGTALQNDRSKKVRDMAQARLEEVAG